MKLLKRALSDDQDFVIQYRRHVKTDPAVRRFDIDRPFRHQKPHSSRVELGGVWMFTRKGPIGTSSSTGCGRWPHSSG